MLCGTNKIRLSRVHGEFRFRVHSHAVSFERRGDTSPPTTCTSQSTSLECSLSKHVRQGISNNTCIEAPVGQAPSSTSSESVSVIQSSRSKHFRSTFVGFRGDFQRAVCTISTRAGCSSTLESNPFSGCLGHVLSTDLTLGFRF